MKTISLPEFVGFDWDQGNIDKNWLTHQVTPQEAEQVFFNAPLLVADDEKHSRKERRMLVGHPRSSVLVCGNSSSLCHKFLV